MSETELQVEMEEEDSAGDRFSNAMLQLRAIHQTTVGDLQQRVEELTSINEEQEQALKKHKETLERLQKLISAAKQKIKEQAAVISEQCIILRSNGCPQAFTLGYGKGSSGAQATTRVLESDEPLLTASTQHREADSTLGKNNEDPIDLSRDDSPTVSDRTWSGSSSPPSPAMLAPQRTREGPSAPPPMMLDPSAPPPMTQRITEVTPSATTAGPSAPPPPPMLVRQGGREGPSAPPSAASGSPAPLSPLLVPQGSREGSPRSALAGPQHVIYSHTHGIRTDYETPKPGGNRINPGYETPKPGGNRMNPGYETPKPGGNRMNPRYDTRTVCETPKYTVTNSSRSGKGIRKTSGKVRYKAVGKPSPVLQTAELETTPREATPTDSHESTSTTGSPSFLSKTSAAAEEGFFVGEEEEEGEGEGPMSCSLFAATDPAMGPHNLNTDHATPSPSIAPRKTPRGGVTVDQVALKLSTRKMLAVGNRMSPRGLVGSPDVVPVTPGVKLVENILEDERWMAGSWETSSKERRMEDSPEGEMGRSKAVGKDSATNAVVGRLRTRKTRAKTAGKETEEELGKKSAGNATEGGGTEGTGAENGVEGERTKVDRDATGTVEESESIAEIGINLKTKRKWVGTRTVGGSRDSGTAAKVSKTLEVAAATGVVKQQYRRRGYNLPSDGPDTAGTVGVGRKRQLLGNSPVLGRRSAKKMASAVRGDRREVVVVQGDSISFTEHSEPQVAARDEEINSDALRVAKRMGLPTNYKCETKILKTADRDKLDAKACPDCIKWYESGAVHRSKRDHLRHTCRHKALHLPPDSDPRLWDISFPDTDD